MKKRLKKIVLLICVLTLCFNMVASSASDSGYIRVTGATNIHVRSEASTDSASLGRLDYGAKVTIKGESGDWYMIAFGAGSGYIMKKFVVANPPETLATVAPTTEKATTQAATVKATTQAATTKAPVSTQTSGSYPAYGTVYNIRTNLTVRKSGDSSGAVVGSLQDGARVTVYGLSGDYYQIKYGTGTAYVSKNYVKLTGDAPNETAKAPTTQAQTTKAPATQAPSTQVQTTKAPAAEISFQDVKKTGYANVTTNLLVRSIPSTTGTILGRYASKTAISIIGESKDWYKVSYLGKTAYVMAKYVTFTKPVTETQASSSTTAASSSTSSTSAASTGSSSSGSQTSTNSGSTVTTVTNNAASSSTGSAALYTTYSPVSISVPLYHQYDSAWASHRLGNSSATFRSAGCVTTCLAMLEEQKTKTTCTPLMMEAKLSYTSGGSVYWPRTTTQYTGTDYLNVIYNQLRAGKPVIIGAKWASSNAQHYVVVTGYNGSTSKLSPSGFTVNDPGTAGAKNLAEFFGRTPRFYKLVYYK